MKKLSSAIIVTSTLLLSGCLDDNPATRNYREDMRNFVQGISTYAKGINSNFIIIPQNGHELLEKDGDPALAYLETFEGIGQEDLFYGYDSDDEPTPSDVQNYLISLLNIAMTYNKKVLIVDYCSTHSFVDDSYNQSADRGHISFAADHRELDDIPPYPPGPFNMNSGDITSLAEAKNFLYLINPGSYSNKAEYLNAVMNTNYDIIIIDAFYGAEVLSRDDVGGLKSKANGGKRLVISYISIGEAEDYRYYWQTGWETNPPPWLAEENPDWPGNYKVRYWDTNWQNIIYGNNDSYLKIILDAGFDGVYLDITDAFEYFEN